MLKKLILLPFFVFAFAFLVPFYITETSYAVTSNCVVVNINAPGEPTLPPQCAGGAQEVLDLARKLLGKPYLFGGPSPRGYNSWDPATNLPPNGDCSFLVGWSWYWATDGKVNFPVTTRAAWEENFDPAKFQKFLPAQKAEIKPGDAIYWKSDGNIRHTALFSGPCQDPANGPGDCILEAQQTGVPIKESNFEQRISGGWAGFLRPIQ